MNLLQLLLTLAAVLPAAGMLTLIWRTRDGSPAQRAYDRHIAARPVRDFDPRLHLALAMATAPDGATADSADPVDSSLTSRPRATVRP